MLVALNLKENEILLFKKGYEIALSSIKWFCFWLDRQKARKFYRCDKLIQDKWVVVGIMIKKLGFLITNFANNLKLGHSWTISKLADKIESWYIGCVVCVCVCVEFAGLLEMVLLAHPACMDTLWLSHLAVGEFVINYRCEWIFNWNSPISGPTLWLPPQLLTLCCHLACWNCGSVWSSLCILYQIYQLPKALVDLWFRALASYYFKFLLDFWFFSSFFF